MAATNFRLVETISSSMMSSHIVSGIVVLVTDVVDELLNECMCVLSFIRE